MSDPLAQSRLEQARAHHRRGELGAAIAIYREIVQAQPAQAAVWHLKGMAEHQAGDLAAAGESAQQGVTVRLDLLYKQ